MIISEFLGKVYRKLRSKIFIGKWVMAIKTDEENWKIIDNKLYSWEADPFLVEGNGKYYVFYEDLKIGKNGTIFVGEVDREKKEVINKREVLREEYHLSYPNVFKLEGKYYMIPETYQAGKLLLYEAVSFPDKWRVKKVLLDNISCADCSFFKKDNLYYYFLSPEKDINHHHADSLECYYTEDILNIPLQPLKNRVVAESIEMSRMGGNFLLEGEDIYRLSQDCSRIYGETLNVHKVVSISKEKYEEKFIKKLKKPDGVLGMHTYTKVDDIEIIDLYIEENIFKPFKKEFKYKLEIIKIF